MPAVVVGVTALVFLPVLSAGFLNWDDSLTVVDNPHIRGLGWPQVEWAFSTFFMGHYQPLSWLTLSLDHVLWGSNPGGYHLTNLLLHVANSLLVFFLIVALSRWIGNSTEGRPSPSPWLAGLCALLFSIHPLRVESVAWITERRDVLSAFFLLLSFLTYLHFARSGRRVVLLVSIAFFGASLLAKASAALFVLLLLLVDLYPLQRLARAGELYRKVRIPVLLEKLPFLILGAMSAWIAPRAQQATGALMAWSDHGFVERLGVAAYGWLYYLRQTLVPRSLSPLYELPLQISWTEARFVVAGSALVLVSVAVLFFLWKMPRIGVPLIVALGSYTLLLAPVLGLFQSGPQFVADRYSYLPAVVLSVVAYLLLNALVASRPELSRTATALVVVLVVSMGLATGVYVHAWRNSEALWKHALESQPECAQCRQSLAMAYLSQGRGDEAAIELEAALGKRPNLEVANHLLASLFDERGEWQRAKEHYRQANRVNPSNVVALSRYAALAAETGEVHLARAAYSEVLVRSPEMLSARLGLADLESRSDCSRALALLAPLPGGPPDSDRADNHLREDVAKKRAAILRRCSEGERSISRP